MQRNEISILQIGNEADRLAAMKAGQIDLSVFTPTYLPVIEKAGMKVLLDLEKLGVPYALNGYTSTRSYIAKSRPMVGFMRAVIKAIKRIKTDREFSRKILEKYVRIDDPQFINAALDQRVKDSSRPALSTRQRNRDDFAGTIENLSRGEQDNTRIDHRFDYRERRKLISGLILATSPPPCLP